MMKIEKNMDKNGYSHPLCLTTLLEPGSILCASAGSNASTDSFIETELDPLFPIK